MEQEPAVDAVGLAAAREKIHHLETSRDAMLASIESLKVLVSTERMQTRVMKRRLATATQNAADPERDAELVRLKREAANAADLAGERDLLKEQLTEMHARVEENERLRGDAANDRASALEHVAGEHDAATRDLEHRLREETGTVVVLNKAVAQLPELRSRVKELEGALREKDVALRMSMASEHSDAEENVSELLTKASVKRKLMELKIARNVIAEKDKVAKEMRVSVSTAEARELESVIACKLAEERARGTEDALVDAQRRAAGLVQQLKEADKLREAAESHAQNARSKLSEEENKAAALAAQVGNQDDAHKELDDTRKELEAVKQEHTEFRSCVRERLEIAEEQRTEALEEAGKLKKVLETSEKEVIRLQNVIGKRGGDIDDMGTASPCSLDANSEEPVVSSVSECESIERMNELEEQARLARSSYEQKCLEAQTLASSVSDNATTIVTLNRALLVSRKACDEKHAHLEGSIAKASGLEKTLRKLRTELATKVQECASLEKRIIDDLEPNLRDTTSKLEQRVSDLERTQADLALHKELSEKARVELEQEVTDLSERLQNTLSTLSSTQNRLTQSEQRGASLDSQVAELTTEKGENLELIGELKTDCEHRLQSLLTLQTRLSSVERHVAEQEQAAFDANQSNEQLNRLLVQAQDRQTVAEGRAARMDAVVVDLENRAKELADSHSSIHDQLDENMDALGRTNNEVCQLKEIADIKEEALQKQAVLARDREALFESQVADFRAIIDTRDQGLKALSEDLHAEECRSSSLEEMIKAVKENLKSTEQSLALSQQHHRESEAEGKRLQAELRELHEKCSHLEAEYASARDELTDKDRQISTQLLSLTEKGEQVTGLRAEKAELEKLVQEFQSELGSEKEKSEMLLSQVAALEEALTIARSNLTTCEEELSMRSTEADSLGESLANSQADVLRFENCLSEREESLEMNAKTIKALEISLERSKQQLTVLESHLDGHDSLLEDCREKEEALAVNSTELDHAKEYTAQVEQRIGSLQEQLAARTEQVEELTIQKTAYESCKADVEQALREAQDAQLAAESNLKSTAASLAALEKTTDEEREDLKATITSLRNVLNDKESSSLSISETQSQTSVQNMLAAEQLVDSRSRGDRLFASLTAAQSDLASKKDSLLRLGSRLRETQEKLKARDAEVEKLERNLLERNQALSQARTRIEELSTKTGAITKGELLTLQTKLEAKEKAITNLHNWCCFINGKLHAAEKALSEREVDLDVSSTAFQKLEAQLQHLNGLLAEKDSHIREIESSRVVEQSELRSRIQSLQCQMEQSADELQKTEQMMSSDGNEGASWFSISEELGHCKEALKVKEVELSQSHACSESLQEAINAYERELTVSKRTIESLTLDAGRLRTEVRGKTDAADTSEKQTVLEVSKVRSETEFLLVELQRAEAELSEANENSKAWQSKAEELQPLAESTRQAQRDLEMVSARLSLTEKESKHRMDLLETQLGEAKRDRDIAERDCSAAIADYAAMRARLMDSNGKSSAIDVLRSQGSVSTVTFTLEGVDSPSSEIMVYLLGGHTTLGQWKPAHRVPVRVVGKGRQGLIRKCDVVLPTNVSTLYKYVADGPDGQIVWEGGENRSLEASSSSTRKVHDIWRSPL